MSSNDNNLSALLKRIEQLEKGNEQNLEFIRELEADNKKLKNKYMELKMKTDGHEVLLARSAYQEPSVFSVRLTTNQNLAKNTHFRVLDKTIEVYRASRSFDATTCRFSAPVDGHYYLDMGMRQSRKGGSLEAMLIIVTDGKSKHAYIGKTNGAHSSCHKSMIVTMKSGDTVHGVVRRLTGSAGISWCSFSGYLIATTDTEIPSEAPVEPPAPPNTD